MSSSVTTIAVMQKRVEEMQPSLSKAETQVLELLTYGRLVAHTKACTHSSSRTLSAFLCRTL
jgi:hypothetical protein